jgi:hypothetical protein
MPASANGSEELIDSGKVVADRGDGDGGGSALEEEGLRRGVDVLEDIAEFGGGRTRLARRKVKNANWAW